MCDANYTVAKRTIYAGPRIDKEQEGACASATFKAYCLRANRVFDNRLDPLNNLRKMIT